MDAVDVEVKKFYSIYIFIAAFFVVGLLMLSVSSWYRSLDVQTLYLVLALSLVLVLIHELVHYVVAKRYSPNASIQIIPKLGSIALDYVRLDYRQYIKVTLAPILIIQLPLTIAGLVTGNAVLTVLALLHLVASVGDITGLVSVVLYHRGATLNMVYDEKGRIVGIVVEKGNKIIFYQL